MNRIKLLLFALSNSDFYNVIIDSEVIARIQTKTGLTTYDIATGLKDTNHEIEILNLLKNHLVKLTFVVLFYPMEKRLWKSQINVNI